MPGKLRGRRDDLVAELDVPANDTTLGRQYSAAASRWQSLRGKVLGCLQELFRIGRSHCSGRMEERLCRKQGFSWLVDEDRSDDTSGRR